MISVIVPIYNSDKYIARLFECLDNQSFEDFELILINDGSTDNSLQICKDYANDRKNVFIYSQDNQGVSAARNLGLEKAKGDFIAFLDSDDRIPNNYLSELQKGVYINNADISVCDVVMVANDKEIRRFTCDSGIISRGNAINYILTRKRINSGPCGKLFKRELIGDIRFEQLKIYEDILFVLNVFDKAGSVCSINTTEYQYIQNEGSAMDQAHRNVSLDIISATKRILSYLDVNSFLDPECLYVTLSHLLQHYQNAVSQNNTGFINEATSLFAHYRLKILKCPAFSWKEKIVFLLLGFGIFYNGSQFINLRRER